MVVSPLIVIPITEIFGNGKQTNEASVVDILTWLITLTLLSVLALMLRRHYMKLELASMPLAPPSMTRNPRISIPTVQRSEIANSSSLPKAISSSSTLEKPEKKRTFPESESLVYF